jgi:hypothetical protein
VIISVADNDLINTTRKLSNTNRNTIENNTISKSWHHYFLSVFTDKNFMLMNTEGIRVGN